MTAYLGMLCFLVGYSYLLIPSEALKRALFLKTLCKTQSTVTINAN